MKKDQVICDFTTGICGPADEQASDGIIEFVDPTQSAEEVEEETNEQED